MIKNQLLYTHCQDCGKPLVPMKAQELPEGHERHAGRGLGWPCWRRNKKLGRFTPGPRGTRKPTFRMTCPDHLKHFLEKRDARLARAARVEELRKAGVIR